MAGGNELVRVARNKKCYNKISTTEHCARTVLSIYALGKKNKYTIPFFARKEIFVEKKKKKNTHIFLISDRQVGR